MRGWLVAITVLACSVGAATMSDFNGTWLYDKAASADVEAAVEACVAKTNFVKRAVARPRLKKTNIPYERIVVSTEASSVTVLYGANGKPITTPSDGKVVPWTREDGEVFQTSHVLKGEKMVEVFRGEDGQKRTDFTVSADHAILTLDVTVSSPRLPEPLVYKLVYRKRG